ncbi:MAG: amidohydrolase family protein [Lachnospiraceae bacterium]
MKIRFYNSRILSMQTDCSILHGEVWVEDDKITYVGGPREEEAAKSAWDQNIDAQGNVLMPGFKNAHTHSAMTFLRSYADDLPLQDWLQKQVFPMEAKLTGEDVYTLSKLAYMEYLTSGITADFDMYFHVPYGAKASVDTGFRTVFCESINNFGGTIEEVEEAYLKYNAYHPLISYQLGFHAEYTTSPELMQGIARLSQKYQAPVYAHNSETKEEVAGCIERYGMTPTAYMNQIGMFEHGGGGFHCVYMTEQDLEIFKEKQLAVITNPASNMKLASGIAPLTHMQEMGIRLAIGTDGPASNNCLDMFREMFLATALQKVDQMDAAAMDAESVLYMATVGGAHAMQLYDCDCLAEGKQADMIMIDLHQPNMQPMNNIAKNIVYAGSKSNVKMTMIAGKILYRDGSFFLEEAADDVYEKANTIIRRMS